jgi:hypothetical protein
VEDVTDGASNTFLFGERLHHDPEFDRLRPLVWPDATPVGGWGRWGYVANAGAMFQVTLHAAAPINDRVPPGETFPHWRIAVALSAAAIRAAPTSPSPTAPLAS